jgi:hypothetical protein
MQANPITRQTNNTTTLTRRLSNISALTIAILFSTACNSAPQNELQPFNYKDANRLFEKQRHDGGVWFCGYAENKSSENTDPEEVLIAEIDEKYLYIKKSNNIIELIRDPENNDTINYSNASQHISARIKILKLSNFSEYQESHDRTVEIEISTPKNRYSLQLLGESCGI